MYEVYRDIPKIIKFKATTSGYSVNVPLSKKSREKLT